jgi:hypothetical protein
MGQMQLRIRWLKMTSYRKSVRANGRPIMAVTWRFGVLSQVPLQALLPANGANVRYGGGRSTRMIQSRADALEGRS